MANQTTASLLRKVAIVASLSLALPLITTIPAYAATSTSECREGSRDIDARNAHDLERRPMNGSLGRAEITLRSNADGTCYWGLINGRGAVWLERSSPFYDLKDYYMYPRENRENDVTHTAATVTTEHAVRACGRPYDGEATDGSGWNFSVNSDGRRADASGGYDASHESTYSFPNGTECTGWYHHDPLISNLVLGNRFID